MIDHKQRWVFSPLDERGLPAVRAHALRCSAPLHHNGYALTLCVMDAQQLAAARKDPSLIVCGSIHETAVIHEKIADHHAEYGAKRGMRLHELLLTLAKLHHGFEPEV